MRFDLFAVEDTAIQVTWDRSPAGMVEASAVWNGGSVTESVASKGGPGGVVLSDLPHSTTMAVRVGSSRSVRVTTLAPPPGKVLSRFATINDMHFGARDFGTFRPIWNDDPLDPPPVRCTRAAIAEALAWGADALVVKGDLTQRGRPNEWEAVASVLASAGVPLLVIEGNHDTKAGAVDGRAIMAGHGIALTVGKPSVLDLPGVRIVGVPTARWHVGSGHIEPSVAASAVALLEGRPPGTGGVAVLHHYPQRFRYPTLYPEGIPAQDAAQLLNGLASRSPATIVLAGHSHRHRRHFHGPLTLAEAGSTKDFPGSWAGYTVHEGGIMQTTRRTMEPGVMKWTTRGRRVIGGVWGVWAPGLRSHRCFAYTWPTG